jgi:hypothetical protein
LNKVGGLYFFCGESARKYGEKFYIEFYFNGQLGWPFKFYTAKQQTYIFTKKARLITPVQYKTYGYVLYMGSLVTDAP